MARSSPADETSTWISPGCLSAWHSAIHSLLKALRFPSMNEAGLSGSWQLGSPLPRPNEMPRPVDLKHDLVVGHGHQASLSIYNLYRDHRNILAVSSNLNSVGAAEREKPQAFRLLRLDFERVLRRELVRHLAY